MFATAITLWVSAMNVRYRDVGHLLSLALLVWFWFTPIVYQGWLVQQKLETVTILGVDAWTLYLLNPIDSDRARVPARALRVVVPGPGEDPDPPAHEPAEAGRRAARACSACLSLLLLLAWRSFFHRSGDFAEEL